MLRYTAHQLELAGRHYLPLPKLNPVQMDILSSRLRGLGYVVQKGRVLRAFSTANSVYVDPSGFCWSSHDPDDEILPTIPRLVTSPKAGLPLEDIGALYFRVAVSRGRGAVKFITRLESGPVWDKLRASGGCGLTPDEHFVVRRSIERLGGPCRLITDFPADGSPPKRWGTKTYFLSGLDASEALSTLRVMGTKEKRNSYLPRDGVIEWRLDTPTPALADSVLFKELGDWCSFKPSR